MCTRTCGGSVSCDSSTERSLRRRDEKKISISFGGVRSELGATLHRIQQTACNGHIHKGRIQIKLSPWVKYWISRSRTAQALPLPQWRMTSHKLYVVGVNCLLCARKQGEVRASSYLQACGKKATKQRDSLVPGEDV